eukprot:247764-Prorocentrum_minimum.AAC.1
MQVAQNCPNATVRRTQRARPSVPCGALRSPIRLRGRVPGASPRSRLESSRLICDVKGNSVDVKGNHVDVKGNSVDVKGNHVDVKGNRVDVKGNRVESARRKQIGFRSIGLLFRRFFASASSAGGCSDFFVYRADRCR